MNNIKNIKNEKGAITILVLVSVLFFVSFLVSGYMIVSNKIKGQKEIIEQTKKIYASESAEDAYNSFFASGELVPIYTVEQLKKIYSNENIQINEENGKIYTFSDKSVYVLKNALEINTKQEIGTDEEEWITIRKKMIPENSEEKLKSKFIGNGKYIKVINKENEYEYDEENDYNYIEQYKNIKDGLVCALFSGTSLNENTKNYANSPSYTEWYDESGNGKNGIINQEAFSKGWAWNLKGEITTIYDKYEIKVDNILNNTNKFSIALCVTPVNEWGLRITG